MNKETTKMIPGDELHLTMLMAPYSLNLVTGQDRQDLLAFGRAAFEAGKAGQPAQCLHQIAEPDTQEPFMWAIQEPGGGAYMDDGCVSSVREDVQAEVDGLNSGLDADDDPYQVVPVYLAAAPQAVQAAVPDAWAAVHFGGKRNGKIYNTCDTEKECNDYIAMVHQQSDSTTLTAKPVFFAAAPAHPAEGVPAPAAVAVPDEHAAFERWLMKYLDALTWTQDFKDWYFMRHADGNYLQQAARERWDCWKARAALAATQPAAQGMDAQTAYEAECFRWLRDKSLDVWKKGPVVFMTDADGCPGGGGDWSNNILTGKKLEQAIPVAAQAKQGGV